MGFEMLKTTKESTEKGTRDKKLVIWKKIEKYGKILALATLLSLPGMKESALGQEKGETENFETKIELLKKKALKNVKQIAGTIKEKGQAGKMGQTPVRRWESSDKSIKATVGYSTDSKTKWLILEGSKASVRFFDKNADGLVDRVIINKDNSLIGEAEKEGFNDLKTFSAMEELAEEAVITADLDPENVNVYEIGKNGSIFVIRTVDFQSGEASELAGPEASKLVSGIQGRYANEVENLSSQMVK